MIDNFDVYRSIDNTVSKYIHEDGSETAIKTVKSIQSILNPLTNKIENRETDRNKYSIFISVSVGCFMKCKFCHLTIKNSKYLKLEEEHILSNIKEAMLDVINFNADIKNKFVKLSWMGMGDAFIHYDIVYNVTIKLLDWIFKNNYAIGLDGVDLSTVLPKIKNKLWIKTFHDLEEKLHSYNINPIYNMDNVQYTNNHYSHKNIFRLFYSIGSAVQEIKENVIPGATSLNLAAELLNEYQENGKYSVIVHHVLVDGLNDTEYELDELIKYINTYFKNNELRILRYNFCAKNSYKESENIIKQIQKLSDNINFLKVQISAGTEVTAACGQFIVKDFIRKSRTYNFK